MLEEFHPFALSLILGLLIGVEREYHHKKTSSAFGVRTFAFVALAGSLAARINLMPFTIVMAVTIFALIVLSYFLNIRQTKRNVDLGLTTELAAITVFSTGYLLIGYTRLGIILGIVTLALLVSREWLHKFIREKLTQSEINAAAALIIAIFGVAPFLPDHTIDPLNLINPRQLITLMSLIGLIHFAGYAAMRMFGLRAGLALSGLMGGFISSTAVFLQLRQGLTKNGGHHKIVMASGLLAVCAALSELIFVLYLASPAILLHIWLPIVTMIFIASAWSFLLVRQDRTRLRGVENGEPLNLKSIVKLGSILALLIAIVELAHRKFSTAGLWIVSSISGLFEMHGAALAVSVDHARGNIPDMTAATAILITVIASFFSKIAIIITPRPDAFGLKLSGILFSTVATGGLTFFLSRIQ